jgi:hypothetical protein
VGVLEFSESWKETIRISRYPSIYIYIYMTVSASYYMKSGYIALVNKPPIRGMHDWQGMALNYWQQLSFQLLSPSMIVQEAGKDGYAALPRSTSGDPYDLPIQAKFSTICNP